MRECVSELYFHKVRISLTPPVCLELGSALYQTLSTNLEAAGESWVSLATQLLEQLGLVGQLRNYPCESL